MGPRDQIIVSNDTQTRRMGWSEFCFTFVGCKNVATIKRIADDLATTGESYWEPQGESLRLTVKLA